MISLLLPRLFAFRFLPGLVANFLVTNLDLGPVSPFDAAAALLAIGMTAIMLTWPENYGDANESQGLVLQFQTAGQAIMAGNGHCVCNRALGYTCGAPVSPISAPVILPF